MPENVTALPVAKRLWKISMTDDINRPKLSSMFLIRGAHTVMDAVVQLKKTEGFRGFTGQYPNAEVISVEFAGYIEN